MFTTKARSFRKRRNKNYHRLTHEEDSDTVLVLPGICSLADIFPKNRVAKATNKSNFVDVVIFFTNFKIFLLMITV